MALKRHTSDVRRRPPARRQRRREQTEPRIDLTVSHPSLRFRWAAAISESEWAIYRSAMTAVRNTGVPFLLGGGFALATFTGRWRDTKDIDFYVRPEDRERAIAALKKAGFSDYYRQRPYDRKWIFRNVKSGVIVDIIWAMANQRARVDKLWFERAGSLVLRGEELKVLPMEEFIWCKLYIMQRDHCDWPDIVNLLYAEGQRIDWERLLARLEEDTALLKAMLCVYTWLCPREARQLPPFLWRRLGLQPEKLVSGRVKRNHIRLFDSRAWFAGLQPAGAKLEV